MSGGAQSMTLSQAYGRMLLLGLQVVGVAVLFRLGGDFYEWMKTKGK
jgi:hypothetical protein